MTITARNYAVQARRMLTEQLRRLNGLPPPALSDDIRSELEITRMVTAKFDKAQHFALPDRAVLFNDDLRGIRGRAIRLPFPSVTLEWHGPFDPAEAAQGHLHTPKVVTFAFEVTTADVGHYLPDGADRGIFVASAHEREGKWWPGISLTLIAENWELAMAPSEVVEGLDEGFVGVHMRSFPWDFEHCAKLKAEAGAEAVTNALQKCANNSCYAVLQFCEAMSCSNVGTEVLAGAATAVNARRVRDGKLPLLETRILTVEVPGATGTQRIDTGRKTGEMRQHLRRGHIRNLADGRRVWVNACVVGNPVKGRIEKSYRVHAGEQEALHASA